MMKRLLLIVPTLVLAAVLAPGQVQAHAHLVRADLAPDSHLKVSVGTARFWFDEPLTPALSRIVILNAAGRQVNADTGQINPGNNEELDVTVPTLPDGVYSVRWTSASALDGHVMHGFYLFTVGGPGAVAPGAVPAAITGSDGAALDGAGVVVALAHWLTLLATVIWTGALALEIVVLAPDRRTRATSGKAPAALNVSGSSRIGPIVQLGLVATLVTAVLELEAQAYAATGDWSGPTSSATVGQLLSSHYGIWLGLRALLAALTLLIATNPAGGGVFRHAVSGSSAALGLVGIRRPALRARPLGFLTGRALGALGLAYLLALALSGHAAAVPHMQMTSVLLDWLHLIASSIWIGGMTAIALALLPARDRGRELLDLLDRFSPAAYLALIAAACTGMFNAQVRIDSLATLTGTLYGRVLLIKLALIGALMLLSASHVFGTRPRLRALSPEAAGRTVARTYASLERRLRLEPVLGIFILLCVAVMGQVAPGASAFNATVVNVVNDQGAAGAVGPIATTGHLGDLTVALQVNPADVGQTQFTATVAERGHAVTDGAVLVKLTMPTIPDLGTAVVNTTVGAGGFSGSADLVREGLWKADVLVRTPGDPLEYRDVPFVFIAGPGATFLGQPSFDRRLGPATVHLDSPAGAGATLEVHLHPGLRVRYEITMPDMSPQEGALLPRPGGWYRGIVVPPMEGYMNMAIQVQEDGSWHAARMLVCDVNGNYQMQVLL